MARICKTCAPSISIRLTFVRIQNANLDCCWRNLDQERKNILRSEFLKNKDVPKQAEARQHLGSQLAKIFFQSLDQKGKEYLALIPPSKGPHTCLLGSPSDTSVRQFALKAPLTSRAVTHFGILDVGQECLLNFENEITYKHQKEMQDLEQILRAKAEEQVKVAIEETRKQEKELYHKKHEELTDRYEKLLFIAVNNVVKKLERECDLKVQKVSGELDQMLRSEFEHQLTTSMKALEEYYKEETLNRLASQRNEFHQYLQYIRQATSDLFKEIQVHHLHALQKLRNDLETANVADICFITARERKSCQDQKKRIWEKFDETVGKLKKLIEEKEMKLTVVNFEVMQGKSEAAVWQEKVDEILFEFQRFVSFALKSLPEHSAYLIDKRKLLETVEANIRGIARKKVASALENLFGAVMKYVSEKEIADEIETTAVESMHSDVLIESERKRLNTAEFMEEQILSILPHIVGRDATVDPGETEHPITSTFIHDHIIALLPPKTSKIDHDMAVGLSDLERKQREATAAFIREEISNLLSIFRKHPSMADLILTSAKSK